MKQAASTTFPVTVTIFGGSPAWRGCGEVVEVWGLRSAWRRNLQDQRDGILRPHVRPEGLGRNGPTNDRAARAADCHGRGFAGAQRHWHAVRIGGDANADLALRKLVKFPLHLPFTGRNGRENKASLGVRGGLDVGRDAR